MNEPNFLFYDLETFSSNTYGAIAQVAMVRTNRNFEQIEQPKVLYCKLPLDFLPDPEACLITGITPDIVEKLGVSEVEFARAIYTEITKYSNTCLVGYNNLSFDNPCIANLFRRNFVTPYEYLWKNQNSTFDIYKVVLLTYATRPSTLIWPLNSENQNKPTFKLEYLSKSNNISHESAHDALSDVYATIGLAKLINEKNPKLMQYAFNQRLKTNVLELLNNNNILIKIDTRSGFDNNYLDPIYILQIDVKNNKCIYFNLRHKLTDYLNGAAESKYAVGYFFLNKFPNICSIKILNDELLDKSKINLLEVNQNAMDIGNNIDKILAISENSKSTEELRDIEITILENPIFNEQALYKGLIDNQTQKIYKKVHSTDLDNLVNSDIIVSLDESALELWEQFIGRNFISILNKNSKDKYFNYCRKKIIDGDIVGTGLNLKDFDEKVNALLALPLNEKQIEIINKLIAYKDSVLDVLEIENHPLMLK